KAPKEREHAGNDPGRKDGDARRQVSGNQVGEHKDAGPNHDANDNGGRIQHPQSAGQVELEACGPDLGDSHGSPEPSPNSLGSGQAFGWNRWNDLDRLYWATSSGV